MIHRVVGSKSVTILSINPTLAGLPCGSRKNIAGESPPCTESQKGGTPVRRAPPQACTHQLLTYLIRAWCPASWAIFFWLHRQRSKCTESPTCKHLSEWEKSTDTRKENCSRRLLVKKSKVDTHSSRNEKITRTNREWHSSRRQKFVALVHRQEMTRTRQEDKPRVAFVKETRSNAMVQERETTSTRPEWESCRKIVRKAKGEARNVCWAYLMSDKSCNVCGIQNLGQFLRGCATAACFVHVIQYRALTRTKKRWIARCGVWLVFFSHLIRICYIKATCLQCTSIWLGLRKGDFRDIRFLCHRKGESRHVRFDLCLLGKGESSDMLHTSCLSERIWVA